MTSSSSNNVLVVLFGAGKIGRAALNYAKTFKINIDYVVDNNEGLWGKDIYGFPVCSPDILRKKQKYSVIVAVSQKFYPEIKNQLTEMGLVEDKDFLEFRKVFPLEIDNFGFASGVVDLGSGFTPVKSLSANRLGISKDRRLVYRFADQEQAPELLEIYNRCSDAGIFGKYLVNTKCLDKGDGAPLRLEHEFIPLFSYAVEWSPKMFFAYTQFMIAFLSEIDCIGLGWRDAHAFNATFHKGKFVFFDFDALCLGKTSGYRIQEFIHNHIIILLMMEKNLISRSYLYLDNAGVIPSIMDVSGYLSDDELERYKNMERECQRLSSAGDIQGCCAVLKEYVSEIQIPRMAESKWGGYQDELYDTKAETEWSDKQREVIQMIRSVGPKTLLDLAGNMGWYEFTVHNELERCIVADLDCKCIDFVYQYAVDHSIENVYPVYLNLVTPTTAYYKDTHIGDTSIIPWRKSAIDRFKSEMVLALAVVHHLAFAQQLSFEEIIGQFALYTDKWLIIEFMERHDSCVEPALKNKYFDWYTQDNFECALNKQFRVISSVHSESTRILYLCEKKDIHE